MSDVRQTSSLDPAYLRAAIAASWRGWRNADIPPDEAAYWYEKAITPEVYSDLIARVGWNAYWEARMDPANTTASADPKLGDQPARFQPVATDPTPPPPAPDPLPDNAAVLAMLVSQGFSDVLTELRRLETSINAGLTKLAEEAAKGIKFRF